MSGERWRTLEQVSADLAAAADGAVAGPRLDARCVVVGGSAPPRMHKHEEEEWQRYTCSEGSSPGSPPGRSPDLHMIQHMLQMVKVYRGAGDDDEPAPAPGLASLVISKPAPACPPQRLPTQVDAAEVVKDESLSEQCTRYGGGAGCDNGTTATCGEANARALLRQRLGAVAAEPPTVARARRRNAAIASLMRLYSDPPAPSPDPAPTPSHCETSVAATPPPPPPSHLTNTRDEPAINDKEVAASIDKVHEWLLTKSGVSSSPAVDPAPAPAPARKPHLTPFTFKRRERGSDGAITGPSAARASVLAVAPATADSTYVPSAEAASRAERYKQQRLAREATTVTDDGTLWSHIERQLCSRASLDLARPPAPAPSAS